MHNLNAYQIKKAEEAVTPKQNNLIVGCDLKPFPSDKRLWKAFKQGNEEAFIVIYKRHIDGLYSFGMQYCDKELVEDLIQDMFIQLREKRSELPNITNSIRLFLFQCLKRRIFNYQKKKQPIAKANLGEGFNFEIIAPIEETIMINEQRIQNAKTIDEAMQSLPKKYREIIYYYFYLGMNYDEIKEMLNYSNVKSARNMLYKVIKTLRKKVSKK